jgi:NTE family protein
LAHIGVLRVLEEEKIPVEFVAGTSVGSLIGAAYCAGVTLQELEKVAGMVRFSDFARWTLSRYGFCSNDRMVRFCTRVVRRKTFEELKIPLAVAATDFRTGEPVVFTRGPLVDPIRASCAYPGMFQPVEIDGRSLVDGMLGYAVPTTPLRQMGADCILAVHLSAHWSQDRNPRHIFEVIGQCFSIAQSKMCDAWKKDADLVLEPDVRGFSYDCFDRARDVIANGETAMRATLPELKKMLQIPESLPEHSVNTLRVNSHAPVPARSVQASPAV